MRNEVQSSRGGVPACADLLVFGWAAQQANPDGHVRSRAIQRGGVRLRAVPRIGWRLQGELDLLEAGTVRRGGGVRGYGEVAATRATEDFCLGMAFMGRHDPEAVLTDPQPEGGTSHEEVADCMISGRTGGGVSFAVLRRARASAAMGAACPENAPTTPFPAGAGSRAGRNPAATPKNRKTKDRGFFRGFFTPHSCVLFTRRDRLPEAGPRGKGPALFRGSVRLGAAGRNPARLGLTSPNQLAIACGRLPPSFEKRNEGPRGGKATPTHPAALMRSSSSPAIRAGRGAPFWDAGCGAGRSCRRSLSGKRPRPRVRRTPLKRP